MSESMFMALTHADVNRHLLSPCDLHRAIEARFAPSSFAKLVSPCSLRKSSLQALIDRQAYDDVGVTGRRGMK